LPFDFSLVFVLFGISLNWENETEVTRAKRTAINVIFLIFPADLFTE